MLTSPKPIRTRPTTRRSRGWTGYLAGVGLYQYLRPFVVGVVHGLAGSAAVALLVLTTIRNVHWAVAYLLIFGVGTIAGMMLITMSIASAFTMVGKGASEIFPPTGIGFRVAKSWLRSFRRLPDLLCERPFHNPRAMDTAVGGLPRRGLRR